jgi:hypothetical protein
LKASALSTLAVFAVSLLISSLPRRTRFRLSGHTIEGFIDHFFLKLSKIEVSKNLGFPARMFPRRLLVCCVLAGLDRFERIETEQ